MKQNNYHTVLYQVIDAVSSLSLGELLTKIDRIVAEITQADSTGIYTLDQKTHSVILQASMRDFDAVGKLKMPIGEGITGWVAQHGKIVVIEKNAKRDPRFKRIASLPDDLYESFLSVPIKNGNVIVGVINAKHKLPHKYPKDQVELIEMIGKLVGRAVEGAILLERTKTLEEALVTEKVISRAKEVLMEKFHISENEAYHAIRKQSMKENKTMKEIAEAVVTSADIFS